MNMDTATLPIRPFSTPQVPKRVSQQQGMGIKQRMTLQQIAAPQFSSAGRRTPVDVEVEEQANPIIKIN